MIISITIMPGIKSMPFMAFKPVLKVKFQLWSCLEQAIGHDMDIDARNKVMVKTMYRHNGKECRRDYDSNCNDRLAGRSFSIIANVQALKNADAQIDFQTDFVTEIARLGF